jgi:2-dehydropantoate 2-reductase
MRIAIVGIGGVGGYFGGKLIQAGAEVVLIARGEHLAALQTNGLQVQSVAGDFTVRPTLATSNTTAVGPVDLVIVSVKSWQLDPAIETIRPLVGPQTGVLPLLNGVEASDQLAAAFGETHALDGICYIFAFIAGPGLVRHVGIVPSMTFGERDNRRTARVEQLQALLQQVEVKATIPNDIRAQVWSKFVFGATTSGLGAITRTPLDELRAIPETRKLLEAGMHEIVAVAQANHIAIDASVAEAGMRTVDSLPLGTTASMQRDIMEGRPSELEAQNGAVVRFGQRAGVATPLHGFIYHALLPQEQKARRRP